jgi:hypothetical protein
MKDTLQVFAKLKRHLTEERETLTKRLAAINAVIETDDPAQIQTSETTPEADISAFRAQKDRVHSIRVKEGIARAKRGTGKLTLDQAVLDAFGFGGGTKGNGKTIAELLSLMQATAGKTHKVTRPTVGLACYRLKKKGQIKNVGRGMYALA